MLENSLLLVFPGVYLRPVQKSRKAPGQVSAGMSTKGSE